MCCIVTGIIIIITIIIMGFAGLGASFIWGFNKEKRARGSPSFRRSRRAALVLSLASKNIFWLALSRE